MKKMLKSKVNILEEQMLLIENANDFFVFKKINLDKLASSDADKYFHDYSFPPEYYGF